MTRADALQIALDSLHYADRNIREYVGYPPGVREQRLGEIAEARTILRNLQTGVDR